MRGGAGQVGSWTQPGGQAAWQPWRQPRCREGSGSLGHGTCGGHLGAQHHHSHEESRVQVWGLRPVGSRQGWHDG